MKRRKITKGTISYLIKESKASIAGFAPIYLKYSYKGVRSEYSIGKSILICNWDKNEGGPVFIPSASAKKLFPEVKLSKFCSAKEIQDLISLMNQLEIDIKNIEDSESNYTSNIIIEKLKNKDDYKEEKNEVYFTDFIKVYNQEYKGKSKPATLKVFNTVNNMLIDYEKTQFKRFFISEINYSYLNGLCSFMVKKGNLNSTIARRLGHVKGFIKLAFKMGHEISNNYSSFSWKDNETDVLALTKEELDILESLDLSTYPRLEKVKDVFLFACYTGLRFSDLKSLQKSHINEGFIRLMATKTGSMVSIPLISKSKRIIDKYINEKSDHILPIPSGQKFNDYLKEVCDVASINSVIEKIRFSGSTKIVEHFPKYKLITAHTARRTFVTLSLEFGMKAEEIMPITGHKDYKSFKRYVNLTEKRAKEALLSAWEK